MDVDVTFEYYCALASTVVPQENRCWYSVLSISHKVTSATKCWLNNDALYQICWYGICTAAFTLHRLCILSNTDSTINCPVIATTWSTATIVVFAVMSIWLNQLTITGQQNVWIITQFRLLGFNNYFTTILQNIRYACVYQLDVQCEPFHKCLVKTYKTQKAT